MVLYGALPNQNINLIINLLKNYYLGEKNELLNNGSNIRNSHA
jgi:hypothetical protein